MDPLTQVLASVALSRAGLNRITRLATPILIATALAPDLDLLSSFGGADAYLRFHRTLFHSVAGGGILAIAIAVAAFVARHGLQPNTIGPEFRFRRALLVSFIGIGFHVLLDLINSSGVQLLWPLTEGGSRGTSQPILIL